MCIELVNKSTQYPRGIAENVIVKIDKFISPVDFVVLDMKEDHKIPIIIGRPFLATTHEMIDVFNKKISFEVGNETITFDIEKSMKFSTPEDDECLSVDMVDKVVSDLEEEDEDSDDLDKSVPPSDHDNWDPTRPTLFATNTFKTKKQPPKVKELPSHLEYAFLNNNQEFLATLAWKVADIKGINPSFCTHKILKEDNFKPVVQPQRRLNPKFKMCDYAVGAVLGQRIDKKFRSIYYASKTMNDAQEHYTTTEKELLAVDAKPRLENPDLETLNEEAIRDSFPDEHLMAVQVREMAEDPWYADYTNFLVSKTIPHGLTYHLRKKFLVSKMRVWDAARYIRDYDACQRDGNISSHKQMPLTNILVSEIMDKEFHEGDEVLFFNSRLKLFLRKFKSIWYGPYTISKVFPYGTVEVCGSCYKEVEFKVSSTRFHVATRFCLGETRLFYRHFVRIHLLQSSIEEDSNAQGWSVVCSSSLESIIVVGP
ncbi:reverse transcriptase domain-containing protein [Tanacetum coccineum]